MRAVIRRWANQEVDDEEDEDGEKKERASHYTCVVRQMGEGGVFRLYEYNDGHPRRDVDPAQLRGDLAANAQMVFYAKGVACAQPSR